MSTVIQRLPFDAKNRKNKQGRPLATTLNKQTPEKIKDIVTMVAYRETKHVVANHPPKGARHGHPQT